MRDSQYGGQDGRAGGAMTALARTVFARLATRDGLSDRPVDEATVTTIARTLLDFEPGRMDALLRDLRRARISDTELVDVYFPEVARFLGCAWAADMAPFTDVSIAVSRMQAILRDVGRAWTSNTAAEQASATVLIVLPDGEQHSFGAMLLAGQLRRQGISVRLEVGTACAGLRLLVQHQTFDCAMISMACEEGLDRCKKVVAALKQGSGGRLWVAVGGPIVDRSVDVGGRTGADIVTSDPLQALQGAFCELARMNEVTG